jgi:monofunctional chorismate mutase
MKTKLDIAREIINDVDIQMIELFKKRMEAAKMVAEYKKENNKPIYDKEREEALINRNIKVLNNEELEQYYKTFLEGVLTASKDYQKDLI